MIIQRLKNLFPKINIHPLTLLYFILAWFGGYLKWYLSTLAIVCFHEICHLMMAYYFHFDIDKVEILPFGAYLSLNDFYFHSIIEEICVVFAGPCSHLFLYIIIQQCFIGVYQNYLMTMNQYIFLFNLSPIYPMDGGRLICLCLQLFIDLKQAFLITLKISVFTLCLLSLFYLRINTCVIIAYLIIQQFIFYRYIYTYLRKYYSQIDCFDPKQKSRFHYHWIYRRGYNNFYYITGQWIYEKQVMDHFLKNLKKP